MSHLIREMTNLGSYVCLIHLDYTWWPNNLWLGVCIVKALSHYWLLLMVLEEHFAPRPFKRRRRQSGGVQGAFFSLRWHHRSRRAFTVSNVAFVCERCCTQCSFFIALFQFKACWRIDRSEAKQSCLGLANGINWTNCLGHAKSTKTKAIKKS